MSSNTVDASTPLLWKGFKKHVINREIKKVIREIYSEIKEQGIRALSDAEDPVVASPLEKCPPPLTRTDADVTTFLTELSSLKCLDEKITKFNTYLEASALPFTFNHVDKIVKIFSTIDFVKIHITKTLLKRMVSLTSAEAVSLINSISKTETDKYTTLNLFNEKISDLKEKSSVLIALFTDATLKTKVQTELNNIKPFEENCVFGKVDSEQVVFVIDKSGSMSAKVTGASSMTRLSFVKQHLTNALRSLKPTQKVDVIFFDSTLTSLFGKLTEATEQNVQILIDKINKYSSGGNTNISGGLNLAFKELLASPLSTSRTIYLLSDGIPGEGITAIEPMKTFASEWTQKTQSKINTVSFLMGYYDRETDSIKENAAKMMNAIALASGGSFARIQSN